MLALLAVLFLPQTLLRSTDPGPELVNLRSNAVSFGTNEHTVAFLVPEPYTGSPDLNGDGDRLDDVLHLTHLGTGVTVNLGLAAQVSLQVRGEWAAFLVRESSQGRTDLNGDGDALDFVLHVAKLGQGAPRTLGRALSLSPFRLFLEPPFLGYLVSESAQGVDLNGDGDLLDGVVERHDLRTGEAWPTGLDSDDFVVSSEGIAVRVFEGAQGAQDLNGDGDLLDRVLFAGSDRSPALENLGLATRSDVSPSIGGGRIAFRVDERAQRQDLNGDGDAFDQVGHLFELGTGVTTNLGLAVNGMLPTKERVLLCVDEAFHGMGDLNGNGQASDYLLYEHAPRTGETRGLGIGASFGFNSDWILRGDRLVFGHFEFTDGEDLNGDGDTLDVVLARLDLDSGLLVDYDRSLEISGIPGTLTEGGGNVLLRVSEFTQGDVNGDGDANDVVLHALVNAFE